MATVRADSSRARAGRRGAQLPKGRRVSKSKLPPAHETVGRAPGTQTGRAPGSEISLANTGIGSRVRTSADGLTRRERLFVGEYLTDFNGTRAAIRAGYAARSAHVTASRVLRKAKVAAAVEAEKAARIERLRMDADEVLPRQLAIARGNLGDLASWGPDGVTIRDSEVLTDAEKYALARVERAPDRYVEDAQGRVHVIRGGVKLELDKRQPALQFIAKSLGMPGAQSPSASVTLGRGAAAEGEQVIFVVPSNGRDPRLGEPPRLPEPSPPALPKGMGNL